MLISRYQKRLSGPLLDRIDIHVEVPRVPFQKLSSIASTTNAAANHRRPTFGTIRARVEAAPARQAARFVTVKDSQGAGLTTNAAMGPTQVRGHCPVDETGRQLLGAAMQRLRPGDEPESRASVLSLGAEAGAELADVAGSERVQPSHIAEAIQCRPRRQE